MGIAITLIIAMLIFIFAYKATTQENERSKLIKELNKLEWEEIATIRQLQWAFDLKDQETIDQLAAKRIAQYKRVKAIKEQLT